MRLSEEVAPELIHTAYAREVADTSILYEGMSLADLAHVVVLTEAQIIPREAGGELLHALLAAHPKPPLDFIASPETGDVYSNREAYLQMLTPHAGYLSAGRARREAITIGYRIAVRSRLLKLAAALTDCARAGADLAEKHITTIFPDYTYLQAAQPTTFGHYMLAFVYPILRDLDRLRGVFARTNVSPAGSGSVNGSRLPLNRERLSDLLGFDAPIAHTRDAMWQADGPIEVAALVSTSLISLDRLAEDLQIFATQEFGLVELADQHSRISKIMPQKKNPYALTYVRGVAGETLGTLAAMVAIAKTPSGQPDNRIFAQGDVPRALEQAIGAAQLMAGVVRGLTVNVESAARRAAAGFLGATDLAEIMMLEFGFDYHTAHQIVGHAVREALQSRVEISPALIAQAAEAVTGKPVKLSSKKLTAILDPAAIVASRTGIGGASEASIALMLVEIRVALDDHLKWRQALEFRLAEAGTTLHALATSLAIPRDRAAPPTDPQTQPEKTMGDLLKELPDENWYRRRR
jgi:argininosuccinate lyase